MLTLNRFESCFPRAARVVAAAGAALCAAMTLPGAAQAAEPPITFPGVRNAPDPGTLSYGGYFKRHQPVKILFGVGDPAKSSLRESLHNAALSIQYLKAKGYAYKIEIVLYGNAVHAADPLSQDYANLAPLMRALHDAGVEFVVCFNSMDEVGLGKGDVYDYMKLVPAGVLELARRQAEGYAYVRNF